MSQLNTIQEALEELKNGKLILVVDDEDRENEGDFICAAEFATTQNIKRGGNSALAAQASGKPAGPALRDRKSVV